MLPTELQPCPAHKVGLKSLQVLLVQYPDPLMKVFQLHSIEKPRHESWSGCCVQSTEKRQSSLKLARGRSPWLKHGWLRQSLHVLFAQ